MGHALRKPRGCRCHVQPSLAGKCGYVSFSHGKLVTVVSLNGLEGTGDWHGMLLQQECATTLLLWWLTTGLHHLDSAMLCCWLHRRLTSMLNWQL
jgi:hypothetical protein